MYYIDPIDTSAAQILAGTSVTEPAAAGETAWVSGGTYVIGDLRIRSTTHRVYKSLQAHTGRTALPEADPTYWQDVTPTQLWAPFDFYASTAASSTTADITYVISGRYVTSIWVDGLAGTAVSVSAKDATGGTVVFTASQNLKKPALGYWDYAYGKRTFVTAALFTGLPIYPAAEITVTVSAGSGSTRKLGSLVRGKALALQGAGWGGTEWGPKAIPKTFTYRKVADDGTFTLQLRGSAVDLDCNAMIDVAYADDAVASLVSLQGRPIVWLASLLPGFDGLRTRGIAKPTVTYNTAHAIISNYIEGIVQ